MDFARASLFDAPVPDESLRTPSGIDISRVPNADSSLFVTAARDLVSSDAHGFSLTSTSFFQTTGPLDPASLPTLAQTTRSDGGVQLVNVDAQSPEFGARTPALVTFLEDAGPYGSPNMLGVTPYQGRPLRPSTLYAAVVLTSVRDAAGKTLGQNDVLAGLSHGQKPAAMSDAAFPAYSAALDALTHAGISADSLAAINVFRTDDWMPSFQAVLNDAMGKPAIASAPAPKEVFPDFCVFSGTIDMPVYQGGTPPYAKDGGKWVFNGSKPALQRMERANIVITIPRAPMPPAGYPTVILSRTGAGGDRPLVDRGAQATNGGPPIAPGTGPAPEFAPAGFAGVSIDGPLGGLRNPDMSDEQFLIFNIGNPGAIRDNVRQSALELVLAAHVIDTLSVDASSCSGAAPAPKFDAAKLALFSHSMGSTISPLALAFEPRFGAAILSGAGGSWIDNVLYKLKPIAVLPFAELLVGYTTQKRHIVLGDPALAIVQWGAEAADPPVYGDRIVASLGGGRARHVLMVQGIVDHYILPPMANATTLSLGLDLAGSALDEQNADLANFDPIRRVLPLSGRQNIPFPAKGNVAHADGSASTAVVVQWPSDGIEDGHEVIFQRSEPKYQYRCFLKTFATLVPPGVPAVPAGVVSDALCP